MGYITQNCKYHAKLRIREIVVDVYPDILGWHGMDIFIYPSLSRLQLHHQSPSDTCVQLKHVWLYQDRSTLTIGQLSVVLMTTAGHVTHQPIVTLKISPVCD